MNVLGIIPARGCSKGIVGKNLASVAGKPLLAYACEAAQAAKSLTRVMISTDSPAIAECARAFGVEAPFPRPPELARDETPMLDVLLHAVEELRRAEGYRADLIVLLQPTSPLRRARHIDEAVERLRSSGADTVVSVIRVPHRFSPYSVMRDEGGFLRNFWEAPVPFDRLRRQEHPELFARNGPAVWASKVETLERERALYGGRVAAYLMDEEDSLDIDTADDLRVADYVLRERGGG